jgi:hypothetical protein
VEAEVGERYVRPDEHFLHGLGQQCLATVGQVADPLGDGDRQPGDVVAADLDFAAMNPGPHRQTKARCAVNDLDGAAHGPNTAVEGRKKPVTQGLYLSSAMALQGVAH